MSYNNNWNWSWVVSLGICASIAYKNCEKNDFKSKLESNPTYNPTISPNYTPYKPTISPNYTPYYPEIKVPKINTSKIPPTNYKLSLPENFKSLNEKQIEDFQSAYKKYSLEDNVKDLKSIKGLDYINNIPRNNQNELKIPPLNKNNSIDLVEPINPDFHK